MKEIKKCEQCGATLLDEANYCSVCGAKQEKKEELRKCNQCGASLLDIETICPVCGANQESEPVETKNYWKSPIIWGVFVALFVITSLMSSYLALNPIELKEDEQVVQEPKKYSSNITIRGTTDYYGQASNVNATGFSYVNEDNLYLTMGSELVVFDKKLNNRELLLDQAVTAFSEDDKYYYYLDENNDYFRENKETKEKDILLMNAYYVHNLGDKIYYQNDDDNESIHCLDITTNEDTKINDEISYNLIVDQEKGRILYTTKTNELISIALDGSDRKALASNTNSYTYDGNYLYYINQNGLVRSDLEGNGKDIYENSNLAMVNIVDEHLVVHDNNTIYTMKLDGKDVKKLYTIEAGGALTFEAAGDKLLVITKSYLEADFGYEIVGIDGKRCILENSNSSLNIGEEI